jgi:hypothetical protein
MKCSPLSIFVDFELKDQIISSVSIVSQLLPLNSICRSLQFSY